MTSPSEQMAALAFGVIVLREAIGLIRYILDYVRVAKSQNGHACSGAASLPGLNGAAPLWQTIIALNAETHQRIEDLRAEVGEQFRQLEDRLAGLVAQKDE